MPNNVALHGFFLNAGYQDQ
ncbi:unnamed protein product, partial [Rotaria magnacalcarata]